MPQTVTIRPAYADDDSALHRLAALDSAEAVPRGPLLLAEVDGEPRVAFSVSGGGVIADPFFPTADLIALLRQYAEASAARDRAYAPKRRFSSLRMSFSTAWNPSR